MGKIDQGSIVSGILPVVIVFWLTLALHIQEGWAKELLLTTKNSQRGQNASVLNEIFESCLSEEEQSKINCSVDSSANFGSDFDAECLSPGVLRFLGEFDVLDVKCVAPFHLDFDFDGFQPTEAIKVRFWKELSSNATHRRLTASAYHLDLKIYSNSALYKFHLNQRLDSSKQNNNSHKNDFPKLEYPRTGKYTFREINSDQPRLDIYFFFEEPDQDPSFMFNNYTRTSWLESGNLSIPCRPSHAGLDVNLYKRVNGSLVKIESPDFEPWKGFIIPYDKSKLPVLDHFVCKFEVDEYSTIDFTYPSIETFGFEALPPQQYGSSKVTLNHETNIVTRNPITVNVTCVINTGNEHSLLTTIGCENPAHIRLVQEFLLPAYNNLSYDMVANTTHFGSGTRTYELKIFNAFQTGITYCSSGSYTRIYEYAAGLNKKTYQLDFGTDYASLPHTSPPKEVHINLAVFTTADLTPVPTNPKSNPVNSVRLVIGQNYTFSCRIDLFTIAKTILWEVQLKNGKLNREKVEYNFQGEYSYLNLTIREDFSRVFCSAPFWNNDIWRTDDVHITAGDSDVGRSVSDERLLVVTASFGTFAVLSIFLAVFMFRRMRENHKKWKFTKAELLEFENGNPLVKTEAGLSEGGHHLQYDRKYEIPEGSYIIDFEHVLGSGEFGIVYRGTINGNRVIAAKTVKPNVEKSFIKALLSELKIMIYLGKHENILELIGASTEGLRQGSVFIFLEICDLGSLENFLRANRHHLLPDESPPYAQFAIMSHDEMELSESADVMLSAKDLYLWSYQIAQGMDYLSSKNVIHGDLATRNVLLTENKVAKICDFGLSRRLHNYRTYAKNPSNQPLPWPWMAPESLRSLTFSSQSDVWAYGITVWEIFSLGDSPYPGMSPGLDFTDKLRNGLRNIQTKLMPDNVYREVMKECWRYHPEDRPSFNELCFTFDNISTSFTDSRASTSSESGIASSSSGYVAHALSYSIN